MQVAMKAVETSGRGLTKAMTQYAALCYRVHKKSGLQVLLVTSRDTGRWVLPKGWPMKDKSGPEAALREAYEEAGVIGDVRKSEVGLYPYDKRMEDGSVIPCVVTVFPVAVTKLAKSFPEMRQRIRRWVKPKKAARLVDEAELQTLLASFDPKSKG